MKKRNGLEIMLRLVGMIRPMIGYMFAAITMGVIGHLCAWFITVGAGFVLLNFLGISARLSWKTALLLMFAAATVRAILHYIEQSCNHYIAFRILALIRDQVFRALRKLCPAKLEGRDKGDLISVLTSDIELLEVFYAHTISPIAIALIFTVILCLFISSFHPLLGVTALCAYLLVGVVQPFLIAKMGGDAGIRSRTQAGTLTAYVLESMRGLDETMQYAQGENRIGRLVQESDALSDIEKEQKQVSGRNSAMTDALILSSDLVMAAVSLHLYSKGLVDLQGALIPVLALMSSFGPCAALAGLGSTLQNTLASGNRVLDIIDDTPETEEITGRQPAAYAGMEVSDVSFAYDNTEVLAHVSLPVPQGQIIGICGRSGSGKSTLLKLMMRFWRVQEGEIRIGSRSLEDINTADLRTMENYMTQETVLFHDTIANNLRIAKQDATDEELQEACRKASVHDMIQSLPKGYETEVAELGDSLSSGEKQRIGLARVFLHGGSLILMDEPTSSLDSLNEAMILKSIREEKGNSTVVLVSHRPSTMRIADEKYSIENGRMS